MWNCDNWMGGFQNGTGRFFMGFSPFGGLLILVFIVLVIYLLFKIVKSFTPASKATSDKNDSLGILKNRFARGEITQEEYRHMYEILKP